MFFFQLTASTIQNYVIYTYSMAFIQSLSHFISSGISYRRDSSPSPYVLSTSPPDSTTELYLLEHRLQVCAIAKSDIQYFCHAIIKIALLPEARFVALVLSLFFIYKKKEVKIC